MSGSPGSVHLSTNAGLNFDVFVLRHALLSSRASCRSSLMSVVMERAAKAGGVASFLARHVADAAPVLA